MRGGLKSASLFACSSCRTPGWWAAWRSGAPRRTPRPRTARYRPGPPAERARAGAQEASAGLAQRKRGSRRVPRVGAPRAESRKNAGPVSQGAVPERKPAPIAAARLECAAVVGAVAAEAHGPPEPRPPDDRRRGGGRGLPPGIRPPLGPGALPPRLFDVVGIGGLVVAAQLGEADPPPASPRDARRGFALSLAALSAGGAQERLVGGRGCLAPVPREAATAAAVTATAVATAAATGTGAAVERGAGGGLLGFVGIAAVPIAGGEGPGLGRPAQAEEGEGRGVGRRRRRRRRGQSRRRGG